jgi:hypothetical protein
LFTVPTSLPFSNQLNLPSELDYNVSSVVDLTPNRAHAMLCQYLGQKAALEIRDKCNTLCETFVARDMENVGKRENRDSKDAKEDLLDAMFERRLVQGVDGKRLLACSSADARNWVR